jgi:uncharacterized protein (TIGR03067 family)
MNGLLPDDVEGEALAESLPLQTLVEDFWDEPNAPEEIVPRDLEELQGAWVSVWGARAAQLFVAGRRYAMRYPDGGEIYMGTFELDPTGRPRRMDMHIEEGPAAHKGKTARCIYELSGGALRWCAARPGRPERPAGFPTENDSPHLYLLFRREEPA